jgi:hypothetical protein
MISLSGTAQVRCKKRSETIWTVKGVANQKYIAPRIGQDIERELIVLPMVRDGEGG